MERLLEGGESLGWGVGGGAPGLSGVVDEERVSEKLVMMKEMRSLIFEDNSPFEVAIF